MGWRPVASVIERFTAIINSLRLHAWGFSIAFILPLPNIYLQDWRLRIYGYAPAFAPSVYVAKNMFIFVSLPFQEIEAPF
jgi:hypothetical protein